MRLDSNFFATEGVRVGVERDQRLFGFDGDDEIAGGPLGCA